MGMAKKEGRRVETWTFLGKSGRRVAPRGRGRATVQVERQVGKDMTTVKNRTGRGKGKELDGGGGEGGRRETFSLATRKLDSLEGGAGKGEQGRSGGRRVAKSQLKAVAQVNSVASGVVWSPRSQ